MRVRGWVTVTVRVRVRVRVRAVVLEAQILDEGSWGHEERAMLRGMPS